MTYQPAGNTGLIHNQDFERGTTREPRQEVLIEKACNSEFISFHPWDQPWDVMPVITDPSTNKRLILRYDLESAQIQDAKRCYMIPYMSRDGRISIWPLSTHPGPWCQSLLDITQQHSGQWLRVIANTATHRYGYRLASSNYEPPVWPGAPREIYNRIPQSSMITALDHPVLGKLRGEGLL